MLGLDLLSEALGFVTGQKEHNLQHTLLPDCLTWNRQKVLDSCITVTMTLVNMVATFKQYEIIDVDSFIQVHPYLL